MVTPETMPQDSSRSASQRVGVGADSVLSLAEPTEFIATVSASHVIAAFILLDIYTTIRASFAFLRGAFSILLQLFCHFLKEEWR
jgi:hypothetical protein